MLAGKFKFDLHKLMDKRRFAIFQACVIGVASGTSAFLLTKGVAWLGTMRVHASYLMPAWQILPLIGLVGGLIAGYLTEKFPDTSGSGIPQIKAILGGANLPLNFRMALVKLCSGIVALGTGLPLGREGPTVQIGAALGSELSNLVPTTPQHRRQLTAAGAAAGLAAAFQAPIAGVLFVVEELLKDVSSLTLGTAVLACFVASIVSNCLHTHSLDLHLKQQNLSISFSVWEIPAFIVLGVLAGILGALFNQSVLSCLALNRKATWLSVTMRVGIAGLITGCVLCLLPEIFRNYAGLKQMIIAGSVDGQTALSAFACYFFLTVIAYGSGAPGGLFAPSLVMGCSLGYLTGYYTHEFFGIGSPSTFALAGMGAYFAAVARVPMTAIVIVLEMSNNFGLVLPLMVSSIVSYLVAERISEGSIYDRLVTFLDIEPPGVQEIPKSLAKLTAKNIMQSTVDSLQASSSLKDSTEKFLHQYHHGFPIVENNKLVGVFTRTDLNRALIGGIDQEELLRNLMTPNPITVTPDTAFGDIMHTMGYNQLDLIPVVDDGNLIGLITRSDVIKAQSELLL